MLSQRTQTELKQATKEDNEDDEVVLLTIICALAKVIAGTDSAAAALLVDSWQERGDYHRAKLHYLHDHAEDIAIFKHKYRRRGTARPRERRHLHLPFRRVRTIRGDGTTLQQR